MDKNLEIEFVMKNYEDRIRRYIQSKISDMHEAEDVFQEVGLKVVKLGDKLMDIDNMEAWLYQIAKNATIDYYRRKKKSILLENSHELFDDIVQTSDLENYNEEATMCLLEMTNQLSELDKDAIIESAYKGVSQLQLAERWGISYSGAKNRVQRARKKLRKAVTDCCMLKSDSQGNIIEIENESNFFKKCGSNC